MHGGDWGSAVCRGGCPTQVKPRAGGGGGAFTLWVADVGGGVALGVAEGARRPNGAPPGLPKLPLCPGGAFLICWIDRGAYSAIAGGAALAVVMARVAMSKSSAALAAV